MFTKNVVKTVAFILAVVVVYAFNAGSVRAGSLAQRRASIRSNRSTSSVRTNRSAVSQRGYREVRSNSRTSNKSGDSVVKRAFRSVTKVNTRGGGFANTVGQVMSDNPRTSANWSRAAQYTINGANAVKYVANQLNRR